MAPAFRCTGSPMSSFRFRRFATATLLIPGAGGNIGLAALAKSDPDGYTIGVGAAGGLAANVSLYPKMPFDAQKDFVPVSLLAHIPFVLVVPPTSPFKSVA